MKNKEQKSSCPGIRPCLPGMRGLFRSQRRMRWKLIYDTAEQKGSGGTAKNLRGYEARIWKN